MADYSIPLQVQTPNPLGMMGNLVNTAQGVQALQTGAIQQKRLGINLQSEQQANIERQLAIPIIKQYMKPDGTFDEPGMANALASAGVSQTLPDIMSRIADTNSKQIAANTSQYSLDVGKMRDVNNAIGDMTGKSPSEIVGRLNQLKQQIPEIAPQTDLLLHQLSQVNTDSPQAQSGVDALISRAKGIGLSLLDKKNLETPTTLGTGGEVKSISPGWATAYKQGEKISGVTLAPQIVMNASGQPQFVGGAAAQPSRGVGGVPGTWPSTPDVQAQMAATGDMNTHFSGLNASAQSAPLVTSLTKTIQSLAPDAFTGPGGDKRQYMAGLARVFNVNLTGDAQTDTNLMNKAMAQLNISTPAGTDAARLLVEAGQPNSKMDPDAIKEAAGTIASQVRMNQAERNFLQTVRYSNRGAGDPGAYQQGRQQFESNADPRIWQYEELTRSNPTAARAFITRQPDKAQLVQKASNLEAMGFFR